MGQAKKRGSFEQRRLEAEKREQQERMARREVEMRRESPKHTSLNLLIAAALGVGIFPRDFR